ncbi:MAG: MFS transporter [Candidatus Heimdallarchaeota archaeon]
MKNETTQLDTNSTNPDAKQKINSERKNSINYWIKFEKNEIFLLLSFFFFGIAFANYDPYAPIWLRQIFQEDSFLIIGLVVIIPSLMVAIGTSIWGVLADKFGTKKFVVFGFSIYLLMFLCLIFTSSSTYFLVIVLIGNLFGSAQASNFYALTTKSVNKPKSVVLAKITATVSLSYFIMSPVVGRIYDSFSNAMTVQLIIAIVSCSIAIVLIFMVKEKRNTQEEIISKSVDEKRSPIFLFAFLFIALMIVVFTFQSTVGFWAYTSIFFLDTLEIKGLYYSFVIIAKTALAIPLAILLGNIRKTKKISGLIILFTGWSIIVYLVMMLFPTNWILVLLIYSIPMYPLYSVSFYSLVTKFSSSKRRATAFGIFSAIGTTGYVTGILILGAFADSSSQGIFIMLKISLIFASVACFLAIVFFFFVRSKKESIRAIEMNLSE